MPVRTKTRVKLVVQVTLSTPPSSTDTGERLSPHFTHNATSHFLLPWYYVHGLLPLCTHPGHSGAKRPAVVQ